MDLTLDEINHSQDRILGGVWKSACAHDMVLGDHPISDTPVSVPALEILRLITCEGHHISSSQDIWVPMLDDTVFPFRVTWILFIMLIASLSVNSERFTIEALSYNPFSVGRQGSQANLEYTRATFSE